jgi:hypothetical protein
MVLPEVIMMIMMIILILLSSACTILYTYRPQTCIAPGMPIAVPMPEVLTAMSEMPDALALLPIRPSLIEAAERETVWITLDGGLISLVAAILLFEDLL